MLLYRWRRHQHVPAPDEAPSIMTSWPQDHSPFTPSQTHTHYMDAQLLMTSGPAGKYCTLTLISSQTVSSPLVVTSPALPYCNVKTCHYYVRENWRLPWTLILTEKDQPLLIYSLGQMLNFVCHWQRSHCFVKQVKPS